MPRVPRANWIQQPIVGRFGRDLVTGDEAGVGVEGCLQIAGRPLRPFSSKFMVVRIQSAAFLQPVNLG